MAKVSRALWPSASTTWSARRRCSPAWPAPARRARAAPAGFDQQVGHALLEADLAAQRDDLARIFSTMLHQRKVPMCGLPRTGFLPARRP
jgi:hypothetical protein